MIKYKIINKLKEAIETSGKTITREMLLSGGSFYMKDCTEEETRKLVDDLNKNINQVISTDSSCK